MCDKCRRPMKERKADKNDQVMFECAKKECRIARSIKTGFFYENARLGLSEAMLFIHLWSKEYPEKLVGDDFWFSDYTIVDWSRFCRELCVEHFEQATDIIGGPGCIVEIDETMAVKRKYERERIVAAG